MNELKPCPFCGGKAIMSVVEKSGGYLATIYCTSDSAIGCFTKSTHWGLEKKWAIESAEKAWNRREPEGR